MIASRYFNVQEFHTNDLKNKRYATGRNNGFQFDNPGAAPHNGIQAKYREHQNGCDRQIKLYDVTALIYCEGMDFADKSNRIQRAKNEQI